MSSGQSGLFSQPRGDPDRIAVRATLLADELWVISGPALIIDIDTSQPFSFFTWQGSSTAIGNTAQHAFALRAGVYTFNVLGITGAARGTLNWYLDDELVVPAQDWYTAATTYNVIKTTPVAVRSSSAHLLRYEHVARNPSSTSHRVTLTKLWFAPTKYEVQELTR